MDEKAQAALEYLLLIGAAVLVAAIVTWLLFTTSQPVTGKIDDASTELLDTLNIPPSTP